MALPSRLPVALFFSQFLPGGTEGQMSELARRLDRTRFEVHVACLHRRGAWLDRATDKAASVAEFPIRSFRHPGTLSRMREFAAWCRARRISVLHATDLYANVFALPAAAAARVPVRIANRREINADKGVGLVALQRASYAFAHRVVANSRAVASRLRLERVDARSVSIIPNGIDLSLYRPGPRAPRPRRITTVANLRPEKAHDTLIESAARLVYEYPDAEFWLVGGGLRLAELKTLAERRGVGGRVRFLGHREDVPALLAESDIFALTSRSEAFPNSVLEAMATALPVVATDVGGLSELIEHQRNGILIPPDDVESLTTALRDLMDRPDYGAALGEAARQTVVARFSFDRMVGSFEALYLDLLQRRAPHVASTTQLSPS